MVAAAPLVVNERRRLVRRAVPIMGTVAEIAVVHHDPRSAHAAIDAAIDEPVWEQHRAPSTFGHPVLLLLATH